MKSLIIKSFKGRPCFRALFVFILMGMSSSFSFSGSLFVKNNMPYHQILISPSFEQFDFYNGNEYNINILFQYSNSFAYSELDQQDLEDVFSFDMEMAYTLTRLEKRINAYSSFYIEIPVVYQWKGMFDSAISSYHDWVSLSNGGRELVDNNLYSFSMGDVMSQSSSFGLGDVKIGYSLFKIEDITSFRFALSAFAKIPTGSVSRGIGSGSFDMGVQAAFSNMYKRFELDYGVGFLLYGSMDSTYNQSPDSAGYGYCALSWRINNDLSAVVQLYLSSSPYSTGYDRMDDYQAMLSLGVQWRSWQISFSEDVFTYTAPDIMISISRKFSF